MDQDQSFIATFKNSVNNFSGYKNFLSRSFGSTIKYFYLFLLIVSFIGTIKIAVFLTPQIPAINRFVLGAKQFIQTGYPSELVVDVKNGRLSTNVLEPYYIDPPKQLTDKSQPAKFHLIAIDTKGRIEDFSKYQSVFLLTGTAGVSSDKNGALKVYPFKSDLNFRLDKNQYDLIVSKVVPYFAYAKPLIIGLVLVFLILSPFFLAGMELVGELIRLLIWALILFIIAKLLSKSLSYKQIYKLSFFGRSLPIVVSTLLGFVNITEKFYLLIPNLVFFVIMVYVIMKFEKYK